MLKEVRSGGGEGRYQEIYSWFLFAACTLRFCCRWVYYERSSCFSIKLATRWQPVVVCHHTPIFRWINIIAAGHSEIIWFLTCIASERDKRRKRLICSVIVGGSCRCRFRWARTPIMRQIWRVILFGLFVICVHEATSFRGTMAAAALIFSPIFGVCFEFRVAAVSSSPSHDIDSSSPPKSLAPLTADVSHAVNRKWSRHFGSGWNGTCQMTARVGIRFLPHRSTVFSAPTFFCFHYWFNWTIDGWRAEENY